MKKYVSIILCGIITLASVIAPSFTYSVKNTEITKALENKEFYEQGDILVLVYGMECESGIGGFTFDVNYDGDNLDFYKIITDNDYYVVQRDNSVGKLNVSVMNSNADITENADKSVKVAIGFKSLYMLDPSYISFSDSVKNFVDSNISMNYEYTVSEDFYVYDSKAEDVEYEEYVKDIIGSDLDDTDFEDTDTETDTDSEDTDTDKDTPDLTKYIYGDVDLNGGITSGDALLVLRNSVKLEEFTDIQLKLADVDVDGEITSADSLAILRCSVKLDSKSNAGEEVLI